MNIISFVKIYGNKTFSQMPFNDVDALVLAEISYINFEQCVNGPHFVKFKDLKIKDEKTFYYGSVDTNNNAKLFKAMLKSKRYQNIKVGYPITSVDRRSKKQFYAVTFILPNREGYISFRGTDISVNGWQEDLIIAYNENIPGQKDAVEYLKNAITLFKGRFFVGGHSKGGNLAFYSALTMHHDDERRLIKAYSFDGPGIRKDLRHFASYKRVTEKLVKFITGNDMIGVIYNRVPNAKIVYSPGILLGGHDVFTWQINLIKGDFIYMKERSRFSLGHEEALMNWLQEMSDDDKHLAVKVLSSFFGESKTIYDLLLNAARNFTFGKQQFEDYSPEQQDRIKEIFKRLAKYYFSAYSPKRYFKKQPEEEQKP